jgi:hypothetical protein
MNLYQIASTVLAFLLYIPLAWQILTGQVTQNIATWILWGVLDAIAAFSMYMHKKEKKEGARAEEEGNWHLPTAYVLGCTMTILCMLKARLFNWTWFETITSFMVVVCIVGWKISGPRTATILSTAGVVLAGFPQVKDAMLHPEAMPFLVYLGFVIVNVLSTIGGKAWTVKDRLYPLACGGLCLLIALFSAQKFF